ncbi:MAG: phage head spike fiber domain-containing protein [Minisyncoccota bacterium]
MSLTAHRIIQYSIIILFCIIAGGGYWYWQNARASQTLSNDKPSWVAPLTNSLSLSAGSGKPTYSRADGADRRATVTDFAGLIIPVKQNEARFEGARRVENLLTYSEAFDNGVWVTGGISTTANATVAPDGTSTADNLIFPASAQTNKGQAVSVLAGHTYAFSIWLKSPVAGKTIQISFENCGSGGVGCGYFVTNLSTQWQRHTRTVTMGTSTSFNVLLYNFTGDNGGAGVTVNAWGAQLEDVTGQTNQNPSEYVSTNVKTSAPYHGAGVDQVRYFSTQNGNTVASNIVTEATGTAISDATLHGYVSEGTRTNLALQSEDLSASPWSLGPGASTVSVNSTVAPSGAQVADKLIPNTQNTYHYISFPTTVVSATVYTYSVYVKAAGYNYVLINSATGNSLGGNSGPIIDLTNGTKAGYYVYDNPTTITNIGNGWYRVSIKITTSGTTLKMDHNVLPTSSVATSVGNGTSGIYLWGAQLEAGDFASSYIPTTSTTVTRASDILTYPTNKNINVSQGSVYVEELLQGFTGLVQQTLTLNDGTANNRLLIRGSNTSSDAIVVSTVNGSNGLAGTNRTIGVPMKRAVAYSPTFFKLFDTNALKGTDADGVQLGATTNQIEIGQRGGMEHLFGTVKNVKIWKKALSDTQLTEMTSANSVIANSTTQATTIKAPDNTGLVGYWSFEEGTGTTTENASPKGKNTGTLTNGPTWTSGKVGKALSFDGTDDYVQGSIPSSTFSNDWTVTAWFNHRATTTWGAIFSNSVGTNNTMIMTMRNATTQFGIMRVGSAETGVYVDLGANHFNKWILGVIKKEGSTLTVYAYKDGQLQTATGALSWTLNTDNEFYIGRHYASATHIFNGLIDEVRVYNKALSAGEIQALYNGSEASHTTINVNQNDKLTNGLVGLWSFNGPDVSGTTAFDRSGQGNNGTLTNGPKVTQGKVGQALKFDGTDDYVNTGSTFSSLTSTFTISTWVNPGASQTTYAEIFGNHTGYRGLVLQQNVANTNQYYFAYGDGSAWRYSSNFTLTANRWQHIVAIKDASSTTVYVNGVVVATGSSATSVAPSPDSLRFGRGYVPQSRCWKGSMDEFRIYNRVLSAGEVQALYNLGR